MDAANSCPPLVLIEWLDSGQPVPGWQWLEQIEPRRPHLCVSVGFLMQDDATAKVLAPNPWREQRRERLGSGLRRDHHPGLGGAAHACRVSPPRYGEKRRRPRDR